MQAEVIAIGTELLLGQIVDTNSAWIGRHLADAGVDSFRHTKVGDNHDRMVTALRRALDENDIVICCGGLGPTHDDITREAVAEVMGVELERDPDLVARIAAMFSSRNRVMPPNNERQADVPRGGFAFDTQPGTAPGLACPVGDKVIYAVPGVPREMKILLADEVIPDIHRRFGRDAVIRSRTLRTWGESESGLAERLAEVIADLDDLGSATLAFNASGWEGLKVRLTVKAVDVATADGVLDLEEARIRESLGALVFGVDDETMEHAVGELLVARGSTLALAESLTGGLVGARITAVAGASRWFRGGIVSYASDVKRELLGVGDGPVVSESAVRAMALGACRALRAQVGLALSGVAGPDEQDGEPVGTVWIGSSVDGAVETLRVRLPGDRERIRQFAVISALDHLRHRLLETT